jgi:hypothetical protein
MPAGFVNIDRDTPLLQAPNLREWVPDNHPCHFIVDAVGRLEAKQIHQTGLLPTRSFY